jgi:hypothetical protein
MPLLSGQLELLQRLAMAVYRTQVVGMMHSLRVEEKQQP